ncbi:HAD family hydrolase [Pseudomonas sp. 273]|uniref:HAD family hydrolase n=1 Tax=Pseudomonas sp. 273 TaxID=75692 RepID=UPI0023D8C518|nr:HAD family hydrolase [Pseudomonas sp. 273]
MALALFDLDDTLIDGDCASLWSRHMADLGWVDGDVFVHHDQALMALYARGELAMEDYMAFTLAPLAGRTPEAVAAAVEPFVTDVIGPRIRFDALGCLNHHRQAGDRLLVISASAHFLVASIAARLGVSEVLAIDLEQSDGTYSGHTRGTLTYRAGKIARLRTWLQAQGESLVGAHFYSDSRNDLPLLSLVENPRAVNPDPALRSHAEAFGWPILDWR